ncbi:ABC transporter ATP-binding protein/permease [Candidatus Pelagibacter sp.]|nr:ABC transporter ATP-binding protein/permease [Candidatus Pelagibacter sp.]
MKISIIKKIFFLIDEKKIKIIFFAFLGFISSLIDLIGMSIIAPYIAYITNPETIKNFDFIINYVLIIFPNQDLIISLSIILIIIFLFKGLSTFIIKYLVSSFIYSQQIQLQRKILSKIFDKNFTDLIETSVSGSIENIQSLVKTFSSKVLFSVMNLMVDIIIVSVIIIYLLFLNPTFMAMLISTIILFIIIHISILRPKMKFYGKGTSQASRNIFKTIKESVDGFKEVATLGYKNFFIKKLVSNAKKNMEYAIKYILVSISPRLFLEILVVIFLTSYILYHYLYVEDNSLLISNLAVFGFAISRLVPYTNSITNSLNNINFGNFSIIKLYDEFKNDNENYNDDRININDSSKKLEFKNLKIDDLSFSYKSKENIIKNLSFIINKGDAIGIIGPSGSGKTSLIDILLGINKNFGGNLYLNNNLTLSRNNFNIWKNKCAYLPQDNFIFDGTVLENITFKENLDVLENQTFLNIVNKLNLTNFINNLPFKENTRLGEKGSKLSGGQKQKISLARSLYHNREIFFIDEALNALDRKSQDEIIKTLSILNKEDKKTFVLISHDLRILNFCNKIYYFKNKQLYLR